MISELILLNSIILFSSIITLIFLFKNTTIGKKFKVLRIISSYAIISFLSDIYFLGIATSTIIEINIQIVGISLFLSIFSIVLLWLLVYKYWSD